MNIGRKIYYEKATGNVIQDTGERSGDVVETTEEEDFELYVKLAERVPETVGVIKLEYGQYSQDFSQCNGFSVNIGTKQIMFSYPDPEETNSPPVYQKPLTEQVIELRTELASAKEQNLTTMSALADVFELVLSLQDQIIGTGGEPNG